MAFFISKKPFTHEGSFYGIPLYFNLDDEMPMITGTNIFFNDLFRVATLFHNYVVELGAQIFSALIGSEYQPGFPFWIKGEINN